MSDIASISLAHFCHVVGVCGWAIQTSLLPYILKMMLNRMMAEPQSDPFVVMMGPIMGYLGMSFTMSTTYRLYNYFVTCCMVPAMRKHICTYCLKHIFKLSHRFYQNNFSGSLGSKISELVMTIPDLLKIFFNRS